VKLFLDNCLSPHLASALHALSEHDGHKVEHLRQKFQGNTPDEEWLPALAREGDWVVISGDLRIFKTRHLRKIWLDSQLTTFFLAKGWMNLEGWDQVWRLIRYWPRILNMASLVEKGTGIEVPIQVATGFRTLQV